MKPDEQIRILEETRNEIIRFTNELDDKLARKELDQIEYHAKLHEKLGGKTKEELINYIDRKILAEKNKTKEAVHDPRSKKIITFSAAAIVLILMAIIGIIYTNPNLLTGQVTATRQAQEIISYNRVFDHYTETQLELNKLVSLKISGILEGTSAKVKLRINGTDYLVAEITNPSQQPSLITGMAIGEPTEELTPQYIISTDKISYAIGETITITITPEAENKSLYVNYGEETHKLEGNTYAPLAIGEYTAVALIVLPNDILRIETNFTVTEQPVETPQNTTTNQTTPPETPPEQTTGYEFINLCTETCTISETSNPILIVEVAENTTLTITTLTITQNKENSAPEQTHTIPDINLITGQTTTLDLNQYFSDPEGDLVQYDINEIPEINAQITQNALTITSQQPGTYTAFIYATDGDKLTTSNTFQITIQEQTNQTTTNETIPITNETTNQTTEPTNSLPEITDCSNPDPNKRPLECLNSAEYFQEQTLFITNNAREPIARITSIGNLILSGEVIENESFQPDSGDYTIGYEDSFGSRYTTVWFESKTGNLHLAGALHEEMINEVPTPGFFALRNKKGIVLIWADSITGDLFVRGNVIPYRKNILK
jgi:hypothetical protein